VSKIILKNLLLGDGKDLDGTSVRLDESLGDVGQPTTFTILDTFDGVG